MKIKAIIAGVVLGVSLHGCTWHKQDVHTHYKPGLGEIMSLTAMRHAKLWFAGQGQNWALAEYELEELEEGFEDMTRFHPTHKEVKRPLAELTTETMDAAVKGLDQAIQNKDVLAFEQQFEALTAGCNACHQAADFGFNIVTRPTSNAFSNQVFSVTP